MSIRWDSETDWESSQDSSGTTGRNGQLKQGYRRDRPPLNNGLVGYWPLHDDSATDYSGNNNHGTLNGGITTGVAGKGGLQAMSFDGSDDYINFGDNTVPPQVTVTGWVYIRGFTGSADHHPLISLGGNGNDNSGFDIDYNTSDDSWNIFLGDGSSINRVNITGLSLNQWVHFAATYDSDGNWKWYIDGSLSDSDTAGNGTIADSSRFWSIGAYSWDISETMTDGIFSNIRVYNRALSQSEIQELYEWGSGDYARPPSDGVSYYNMDGDGSDSWSSHSTTNNGVVFSSDAVRGQSGDFQASNNDRLVIDNSGDSSHPLNVGNLAASDFTVSAWVKFDSFPNTNNDILGSYDGSWYMLWYNTDTGFRWSVDDSSNKIVADGGTAETGEWYHLTGTYDNSEKKVELYLNGYSIAENINTSFSATASSNPVHIGDGGSGRTRPVNGHIDDVRIYDRKLRPYEISELYRYGTRGRDLRKFLVTH